MTTLGNSFLHSSKLTTLQIEGRVQESARMPRKEPPVKTYHVVKTLVIAEAIGCFAFSYTHILKVVQDTGLHGWFAYCFPLMIDGLAVLGFIGRSSVAFDEASKKAGTKIMLFVGLVSLVCNVLAGENLGQRLLGAATVGLFVTSEWYAAKLNIAPPVVITEEVEEVAAHPLKGRKWTDEQKARAAATRAANAYKKASTTEKRTLAKRGLKPATA